VGVRGKLEKRAGEIDTPRGLWKVAGDVDQFLR
jgi:hypothetical protein